MTSVEGCRESTWDEGAQMCAWGELNIVLPRHVAALFRMTMRAARKEAGRPLSPGASA